MNKKSISLAVVSLFCATALLAGCSKNGTDEVKEVANMKISGIPTAYQVDETINWSALKVSVSYKDNSKETYAGSQIQYDVTSEVADTTKLVVYTSGLHDQTTLAEGEYNIEAAFATKLTEKYSLGRIVVGKITDDKYTLDSFEAPEFVDTYRQKIADSQAHPEEESSFKSTSDLFTVGTKNVFRFVPRASFELKGATGGHAKRYTNYEKNFFLKEVKADSSKVDADVNDYSIPANQSGVQFNESAAGKKFELTVTPKDSGFAEDSNGHPAVVTFAFQVKSGLNVYTAKELGALNLTSKGLAYNADGNHSYVAHIGKADAQPEAGRTKHYYTEGIRTNEVDKVFYDKLKGDYAYVDTAGLWKDFLTYDENTNPNGIFTPEEITKYTDIKGVFFQNEITLNKEDIPADYFITANEPGNLDGYADMECFRDGAEIYTPIINAAENGDDRSQDVEVNGNYFMLDNKLPLCKSNRGDAANSGFHTYGTNTSSVMGTYDPGHASLFKFCGIGVDRTDNWIYKNKDLVKGAKGILKNLNTKGVIETVTGDNVLSVTAMIAAKNTYCSAEYKNNIIKSYQIGLFPDKMIQGEFLTETMGSKTYKYNTLIENCRVYDCSNCAICNYHNSGTVVKTSEFARFGGAAILNAGDIEELNTDGNYWPYAKQIRDQEIDEKGSSDIDPYAATSEFEDIWRSFTYVDEASSLSFNNYVVGSEAYFTAVGIATIMPEVFQAILPGYNEIFNKIGHAFRFEQQGKNVYNIVSLNLDGHDYVMSKNRFWYGDVVMYADNDAKRLDAGCKTEEVPFAKYQTIYTILSSLSMSCPAIFYTEKGDVFASKWNPYENPQPGANDYFFTADSIIAFFMGGGTDTSLLQPQVFTDANESNTISVLLPSGNTTINAVFELKKLSA
ncbi:MAG: hypothetical protein IJQ40_02360 [Bacilli bacterium]|nr:hypothetical protein [Bacilli bacterium]